jgi:FixJ family two-component response regulator
MPGLDGLQLQQELAASGRAWPIVFVSGHGSIAMCVRAMKAGAIDFLTKPVENDALLQAIERALVRDAAERAERSIRQEWEGRVARLTPCEYAVFRLLATGLLNKQIATRLRSTERTVKTHRSRVMQKLEVQSLAELVQIAHRLGVSGPVEEDAIMSTWRAYAAA